MRLRVEHSSFYFIFVLGFARHHSNAKANSSSQFPDENRTPMYGSGRCFYTPMFAASVRRLQPPCRHPHPCCTTSCDRVIFGNCRRARRCGFGTVRGRGLRVRDHCGSTYGCDAPCSVECLSLCEKYFSQASLPSGSHRRPP